MTQEQMKFKIGDTVRVIDDLGACDVYFDETGYQVNVSSEMMRDWRGKVARIRDIDIKPFRACYLLEGDKSKANYGIGWIFAASMLEPYDEIPISDVSVDDLMGVLNA